MVAFLLLHVFGTEVNGQSQQCVQEQRCETHRPACLFVTVVNLDGVKRLFIVRNNRTCWHVVQARVRTHVHSIPGSTNSTQTSGTVWLRSLGSGFGLILFVLTDGVPHEELSALEGRRAAGLEGLLLRHATCHHGLDGAAELGHGLGGVWGIFYLKHGTLELFFNIVHFVAIAVVRLGLGSGQLMVLRQTHVCG